LSNLKNRALNEIITEIRKEIDVFAQEKPQFDDITMLILNYRG